MTFTGGLGGAGPFAAMQVSLQCGLMPAFRPAEQPALCSKSNQPGLCVAMKMQVLMFCPVSLLLVTANTLAFL